MVVPVNEIAHYVNFINEIAKDYDFEVKSFGHAGDGNLHIYNCSNDMDPEEFKRQVAAFMKRAYGKATELGGLISGEHGIGRGKMEYLAEMVGPVNMRLMEGIKHTFDPNMILNPARSATPCKHTGKDRKSSGGKTHVLFDFRGCPGSAGRCEGFFVKTRSRSPARSLTAAASGPRRSTTRLSRCSCRHWRSPRSTAAPV